MESERTCRDCRYFERMNDSELEITNRPNTRSQHDLFVCTNNEEADEGFSQIQILSVDYPNEAWMELCARNCGNYERA